MVMHTSRIKFLYAFSYKKVHVYSQDDDAFKIIDIFLRLYMYVIRRYHFVYMFEFHIYDLITNSEKLTYNSF